MTESFQQMYPFYDEASRSVFDFVAWQFLYAAQFVFLEFFFRGFLIHGLKQRFGIYAIAVSTVPYCMIHFGKPFPETMGAIIAGIALGGLSLFTGSIWLGAAIHISVAMSMDVLAIFWASFG
jgi:membrane protease YdiL (CAAX protease family)